MVSSRLIASLLLVLLLLSLSFFAVLNQTKFNFYKGSGMVQTKTIYDGGIYSQIPSALSLAGIALRFGASFYGVSSKIFPIGFGTFHAVFKCFISSGNFIYYLKNKYKIVHYKQETLLSKKQNCIVTVVSVPILELVRNRKFYKGFFKFYHNAEKVFQVNTNLYQKRSA